MLVYLTPILRYVDFSSVTVASRSRTRTAGLAIMGQHTHSQIFRSSNCYLDLPQIPSSTAEYGSGDHQWMLMGPWLVTSCTHLYILMQSLSTRKFTSNFPLSFYTLQYWSKSAHYCNVPTISSVIRHSYLSW